MLYIRKFYAIMPDTVRCLYFYFSKLACNADLLCPLQATFARIRLSLSLSSSFIEIINGQIYATFISFENSREFRKIARIDCPVKNQTTIEKNRDFMCH